MKEEGGRPDQERRLLDDALDKAAGQLEGLRAQLHGHKEQAKPPFSRRIPSSSRTRSDRDRHLRYCQGQERCLRLENAVKTHADRLASLRNQLLSAPTTCDVGERAGIPHRNQTESPSYPANAVLIAEDLTPSDTAAMERGKVMGLRRCVAAPPRTWRSWHARWEFPRSPASKRARWSSPMARQ